MSKRKRGVKDEPVAGDEAELNHTADATAAAASSASASTVAASSPAAAAPSSSVKPAKSSKPHPSQTLYAHTRHWLMKNEPPFSLAALRELPAQTEPWVGVRNHQAKCMMVHGMKRGHRVLYYNASVANPHIAGLATVDSEQAYADHTAFDKTSCYFDAKSTDPSAPTWFMVDVKYEREFSRPIYLAEIKLHAGSGSSNGSSSNEGTGKDEEEEQEAAVAPASDPAAPPLARTVSAPTASSAAAATAAVSPLSNFSLFTRRRLSIHPLTAAQFDFLCSLEGQPLPAGIKLKPEKKTTAAAAKDTAAAPAAAAASNTKQSTKAAAAAAVAAASETMEDDDSAPPASSRPSASRSKSVPSSSRGSSSSSSKRAKKS